MWLSSLSAQTPSGYHIIGFHIIVIIHLHPTPRLNSDPYKINWYDNSFHFHRKKVITIIGTLLKRTTGSSQTFSLP
jgi:hypothetical protein